MNIQINITEKQIRAFIEDAIETAIKRNIDQFFREEYGMNGYRELMSRVTERAVEEMPQYFEDEKKRIVDRAAEKLAKGLRISNTEIITALLAIAESEDKNENLHRRTDLGA